MMRVKDPRVDKRPQRQIKKSVNTHTAKKEKNTKDGWISELPSQQQQQQTASSRQQQIAPSRQQQTTPSRQQQTTPSLQQQTTPSRQQDASYVQV